MNGALGLIEVIGYIAAIEAADAAGKAANVALLGIEKVTGGIVTVKLTGDVGAVQAAVSAGARAAEAVGILRAAHVIPRLHEEVNCIVEEAKPKQKETHIAKAIEEETSIEEQTNIEEISSSIETTNEIELITLETSEDEVSDDSQDAIEDATQAIDTTIKVDAATLSAMGVVDLKKLARSLAVPVTSKKIKTAKKEELIDMLLKYCGEDKA
ncbi:MAG: BMC domain-containing protein [Cellulosilyticaceae bacterium]